MCLCGFDCSGAKLFKVFLGQCERPKSDSATERRRYVELAEAFPHQAEAVQFS